MIGSVLTVDGSAARAAFARVSRVDEDHRNASALRFVLNKAAKLAECPIAQACSLFAAGRDPTTNAREFLKANRSAGALRKLNKLLRNAVVYCGLKSPLSPRKLFETTLCRLGAESLKTSSAKRHSSAYLFDGLTGMAGAVAIGRDICNTKIDTDSFERADQLRVIDVANAGEKELAAHEHQVDLALTMREKETLMLTHHGLDFDATVERPDRDDVVCLEGHDAVVVRLGRVLAERDLLWLVAVGLMRRVGVSHLGDAANGDLSSNAEHSPRLGVGQLVKVELTRLARLEAFCRQEIACLIAALKGIPELLGLLVCRQELDVGDQFHRFKNGIVLHLCQPASSAVLDGLCPRSMVELLSLPTAKAGGISEKIR